MSKSLYTTIIEETAPTTTTVGVVGQLYLDSTTKILYQCVAINIEDLTYEWKQIGGGSSETKKYQHIINTEGSTTEGYSFIMYFTIISEKSNAYYSLADLVDYFNEYTIQYGSYLPATGLIQIGNTFKHIQAVGSPGAGELEIVAQHENQLLNIGYACNNLSIVDDNTIIEI